MHLIVPQVPQQHHNAIKKSMLKASPVSHFEMVDNKNIEEIKDKSENENTEKGTE